MEAAAPQPIGNICVCETNRAELLELHETVLALGHRRDPRIWRRHRHS